MSRAKTFSPNSGIPVSKSYRMCRKSTIRPPSDSSVNWERISSRPPYPIASLDLNHIGSHTTHAHDFQSPDNIVMVRSTDQRVIAQKNGEQPPKLKTVTVNTVETYNRNQNTVRKLTTKSVDGVVESKETIVTDINRAPLLGSQVNLRSDKLKTPLTPVKSQTSPRWGSISQKGGLAKTAAPAKAVSKPPPRHDVNKDEFQKQCLERHNEYRAKHGVGPLKLNPEISSFAQEWADKLAMSLQMVHRQPNKYGENLWMYMTTDKSHTVQGSDAVDSWYQDELPKYTFGTEPNNLEAGHLTQVLWEGSHELGVGVAKNGFYTFVVCNYNPPGNFLGEFVDNVPPIGGWKNDTNGISDSPSTESPSKTKLPASEASENEFAKDMLRIHNEYRAKHGVPPLALDANISSFAQDWADHLSKTGQFQHHTQNNPYGENIFWSSAKASAQVVCDSWYNEIKDYTNYTVDPFKSSSPFKSGHYTQMVWKSSLKLGVGKAVDKTGAMIVVANYSPQGNYIGQFTTNVLPPSKRR